MQMTSAFGAWRALHAHCTANEAKAVPSLFVARSRARILHKAAVGRSVGVNANQLTAILAYGAKGSRSRLPVRYDARSVAEIGVESVGADAVICGLYLLQTNTHRARHLAL